MKKHGRPPKNTTSSSKSVSLDILFSGFGSGNSRPNSASQSRPSSASKYLLNSPNYTSYINYERPKSVPYGNEYYLSDPYDILLPQPLKSSAITNNNKRKKKRDKRRRRRDKSNNKTNNNNNDDDNNNGYNIKEYNNRKIIDEALVFPKKVNLKLPNFKKKTTFNDSDDDDDNLLSNYDWNKEIDDDNDDDDQRSRTPATPSILKRSKYGSNQGMKGTTNIEGSIFHNNELSLKRRVSFHAIDSPPVYKLKKHPTRPEKPIVISRFANEFTCTWDAPAEFSNPNESDEETDSEDDDIPMIKEPKRIGFEFHVADSYQNLKLGNGFRRVFSKNKYSRFINVNNLKANSLYYVRVRTQYRDGWSEFSKPAKVSRFKPTTPAPANIRIYKQPQALHITYSFKQPERDGNQKMNEHEIVLRNVVTNKESFRTIVEPDGIKEMEEGLERTRHIKIEPVLEKTEYAVEIRGKNKFGYGEWSRKHAKPPIRDSPTIVMLHKITHITARSFLVHVTSRLGKTNMPIIGFQVIVSYDGITTHERINFQVIQTNQEESHVLKVENKVKANQNMYIRVRARNKLSYSYRSDGIKIKTLATKFPYYYNIFLDDDNGRPDGSVSNGYSTRIARSELGTGTYSVYFSWIDPDLCGSKLIKQELKIRIVPSVKEEAENDNPIIITLKGDQFMNTCKVDDFFPRTKYRWCLRCLSVVGWSQWSEWNYFETPEANEIPTVYFFWKGPWMNFPGWYKGYLIGGHPRTTTFAEIKPYDYPEIKQKVAWNKIRVTPTEGDLSRTIQLGSPESKGRGKKRLSDLTRIYDFDKHLDYNDDEIIDSSSEEEEAKTSDDDGDGNNNNSFDAKDDGYEDFMTNFKVNNIKKIKVISTQDLVNELTKNARDNDKHSHKFGQKEVLKKHPYERRNIYGYTKRIISPKKKKIGKFKKKFIRKKYHGMDW